MVAAATRRDARERALELLYEAESKDVDVAEVIDALPLAQDPYAVELATGISDHLIEIDAVLARYAKGWDVARMAQMDRAVMRLGVFELATQQEVPTGAALSEAVELAGRYGSTDDTSKFVNGVLAAAVEEIRGGGRPWQPIDTVVFDLDGLTRHWDEDGSDAAACALGASPGALAAAAFVPERLHAAMTGALTAAAWAAEIGAELAETCGCDAEAIADVWSRSEWTVDDDMVALIARLHAAGVRLALFSNATDLLEGHLDEMGVTGYFDVVLNSWRLGHAKPSIEAYEAAAEILGTPTDRILFVDDRPTNVAGAVAAGWHAVHYIGVDRFVGVLRRFGIDGASHSA